MVNPSELLPACGNATQCLQRRWITKMGAREAFIEHTEIITWQCNRYPGAPQSHCQSSEKQRQIGSEEKSWKRFQHFSEETLPTGFCTSCPPCQTGHQHEEGLWSHARHNAYPKVATLEYLAQKIKPPCKSCPVRGRMLTNLLINH